MSQEGLECGASLIASNRLLRVTMLSSEWRSTKGGLSTINRELAIQLAKHHNVEVSMYLPQCGDEDKRAAASHNVCLIEAKEMPGYDPVDWLASIPKDHVMDCVIGHGVHLGRQVSHIKQTHHDCKWIQIVHTDPEELGMFKRYANPISRGEKKRRAEVQLCQSADQVVAVGSKLSEAFSHYLRSCGKDQDVFNLTPSIFTEFKDVRQAPGERQPFSVLVFGRGDSEDLQLKGYDIAAKAISELKDMPQPYKLVFVGAPVGEEEKVKELLLKEGISPTQLAVRAFNENREQLAELFQEVDLVIMPSRTEGFGLTALEALSAGLPVLVTGNSGFGEALKKVPFGSNCVVNSEDPKEWAKAIRAVREKDRAVRLKESELLRGEYGKEYSWQEQCDRLAERMLNFTFGRLHLRLDCTFNSTSRSGAGEALGIPAATQEPESVGTLPASSLAQAVVPDGNARETVGNVGSPSPSPEDVMCLIASKLFDKADLSNKEDRNDYLCYLEKVRNVLVCDYCKGSLIIMLQCSSLQILEELWEDYCTGHLNQMAQQFLVTEEVLQTFGLTEVELTTTIFEEEYRACQQYFGQLSGSSERRLTEDWPHSNTIHWGGSTLPTPVGPGAVEDARNRFSSDLQHLLVPEPFQSIPAQELLKDNCRKCGWIRKEQDIINTWRDIYVILHKGCFYYYNKPEATVTAGKFSLSGYRLSPAPEKSSTYQWTFKLVHLQPEKRTYYFAACSEREMNEWMENVNKEMEEYCGTVKPRRQESIEYGDGAEYCYPEVEPKFDPEEFAALFGKPSPSLPRKPATEPPESPEIEPRDMPKKSPNQLPRPGSPPIQKRSEWPKGCSVSNIGAIRLPDAACSALRPPKPFPGSSPVLPHNPNQALSVPSRAAKPPAALPAATSPQPKPKPKPKPLLRPLPLAKHTSEPILNYGSAEDRILESRKCNFSHKTYNMDPQQQNNGFGPISKPRGKAAVIAATVLVVLSGVAHVAHASGEESKTEIQFLMFGTAFLTLGLVLGELVQRLCLFIEEIQHKETRYEGSLGKVFKTTFTFGSGRSILVVSVVSILFVCYTLHQNYNALFRSDYLTLFALSCFLVPQLLFLVGFRELSTVEVSQINERENKNVADGLAWSYYFGYLKLVLPKLKDQITKSEKFRYKISKEKLFILLPKTCYSYDTIEESDPRVKCAGNLPDYQINRGGILKRSYKHTVHRIEMKRPDGRINEYHVILEYATPLMSLYDMSQHRECGLSRQQRDEQVVLFIRKLREILDGCPDCKGKYELVTISGERNQIADVLVQMHHDADVVLGEGAEAE